MGAESLLRLHHKQSLQQREAVRSCRMRCRRRQRRRHQADTTQRAGGPITHRELLLRCRPQPLTPPPAGSAAAPRTVQSSSRKAETRGLSSSSGSVPPAEWRAWRSHGRRRRALLPASQQASRARQRCVRCRLVGLGRRSGPPSWAPLLLPQDLLRMRRSQRRKQRAATARLLLLAAAPHRSRRHQAPTSSASRSLMTSRQQSPGAAQPQACLSLLP